MSTVRLARPDELHAMALVAARAFAHDAPMAYLLDWTTFPDRVALDTPPALRTLDRQHRLFYYYVDGLARGTLLTGGRLVVADVPDDAKPGKERIVAVAYWVAPGAHLDSVGTIVQAKQHRDVLGDRRSLLRGTGVKGHKRAIMEYQQPVDAMQKRECKARGVDYGSRVSHIVPLPRRHTPSPTDDLFDAAAWLLAPTPPPPPLALAPTPACRLVAVADPATARSQRPAKTHLRWQQCSPGPQAKAVEDVSLTDARMARKGSVGAC